MPISFPTNPADSDTHVIGSITYQYNATDDKWTGLGISPSDRLIEGSNKLEIDASNNLVWTGNNLSIGTGNTTQKLNVGGNISIQESGTLYFDASSGFSPRIANSTSINDLSIFTNNLERLTILSGGNIGIGQLSPQGDLHIGNISGSKNLIMHAANEGDAMIRFREGGSNTTGFNEYSIGMDGSRNAIVVNGQGAGEIIAIKDDTGNVGIGEDVPRSLLHLSRGTGTTSSYNTGTLLRLNGTNGVNTLSGIGFGYNTTTNDNILSSAFIGVKVSSWASYVKHDLVFATRGVDTNTEPEERLRIDSNGRILVGPGAIATPKCGYAGIDVPNYDYSIVMGGSDENGNRANNFNKDGRFCGAHYNNAEEPVGIIRYSMGSTASELHMGGGSSLINAATQLSFYTAANTTTTGGSERLRITSDGKIAIGGNYSDTSAFGRQVLISGTVGLNNDSGNIGIGFSRGTSNTYGYIGTGAWAINGLDNDDFGISCGSTGDLVLGTAAGTERLRIDSDAMVLASNMALTVKYNNSTQRDLTYTSTRYIYISDSGNDSTGDGSNGSPWRTMSKALAEVPKFLIWNCYVIIKGSSFTDGTGSNTLQGICGPGRIFISSESGTVTYNKTKQFVVYDCHARIEFQNIAFVCPVGGTGFALERNHFIEFKSGCTYEFQGQSGWSWQAGVYALHNDRIIVSCNTTCTNSSTSGLGGVWLFDNCKSVSFSGDLTKNGARFNNHGIAATNGTWIYLTGDITNFARGLALGVNHYGNETRADAIVQSSTFSNCGDGIKLYHGSLLKNYSSSFSNNTNTNIDASGGVLY